MNTGSDILYKVPGGLSNQEEAEYLLNVKIPASLADNGRGHVIRLVYSGKDFDLASFKCMTLVIHPDGTRTSKVYANKLQDFSEEMLVRMEHDLQPYIKAGYEMHNYVPEEIVETM